MLGEGGPLAGIYVGTAVWVLLRHATILRVDVD